MDNARACVLSEGAGLWVGLRAHVAELSREVISSGAVFFTVPEEVSREAFDRPDSDRRPTLARCRQCGGSAGRSGRARIALRPRRLARTGRAGRQAAASRLAVPPLRRQTVASRISTLSFPKWTFRTFAVNCAAKRVGRIIPIDIPTAASRRLVNRDSRFVEPNERRGSENPEVPISRFPEVPGVLRTPRCRVSDFPRTGGSGNLEVPRCRFPEVPGFREPRGADFPRCREPGVTPRTAGFENLGVSIEGAATGQKWPLVRVTGFWLQQRPRQQGGQLCRISAGLPDFADLPNAPVSRRRDTRLKRSGTQHKRDTQCKLFALENRPLSASRAYWTRACWEMALGHAGERSPGPAIRETKSDRVGRALPGRPHERVAHWPI